MNTKRNVTVTRTAIRSTDNLGRAYVLLFRHLFDAETGVKLRCTGRAVGCETAQHAEEVMEAHRNFGTVPTTH